MKLLSVDPGKHTGWAVWTYGESKRPKLDTADVTETVEEFYDILANSKVMRLADMIVYEDYIIRPAAKNKFWGHEWNRPPALLIIGAVEYFARANEIKLATQQAAILPIGCGYIGYNYQKGIHVPNQISAIAHGAYWLVKNKLATPPVLKD
jgi:hypothetical protein